MGEAEVLMEGIVFGESPRWHDGRLWFSDWGANQVIALGTDGSHEVVVSVASFPMCIDFLPGGQLVVVNSAQRVREGGEVLGTVSLDRGAFACALSRGQDPQLFVVGQHFGGPEPAQPSGQVVAFAAPAPGAGKP